MMDRIFGSFLEHQFDEGRKLDEASDLLELMPIGRAPVQRYIARFACRTLVSRGGDVEEAAGFTVGIAFSGDFLRHVNPYEVATWLAPADVFLPNVRAPFICLGRITPGMSLVDLLLQTYEIGTGAKLTVREDDALNPLACAWARRHMDRFPIDARPLKRSVLDVELEEIS